MEPLDPQPHSNKNLEIVAQVWEIRALELAEDSFSVQNLAVIFPNLCAYNKLIHKTCVLDFHIWWNLYVHMHMYVFLLAFNMSVIQNEDFSILPHLRVILIYFINNLVKLLVDSNEFTSWNKWIIAYLSNLKY